MIQNSSHLNTVRLRLVYSIQLIANYIYLHTMQVSATDFVLQLTFTRKVIFIALPILLLLYFSILKVVFGTYSLRRAVTQYDDDKKVRDRYLELFTARDSMMYHVSWANSRGDFDEAKNLLNDLKALDEVSCNNKSCNRVVNCVSRHRRLTRLKPAT